MRRRFRPLTLLAAVVAAAVLLARPAFPQESQEEPRLPGGRDQKEEILKAEHGRSLEDATRIVKLAEELKAELEKNDRHILSVSSLRKTEEIEKLARRIRSRMRRY